METRSVLLFKPRAEPIGNGTTRVTSSISLTVRTPNV